MVMDQRIEELDRVLGKLVRGMCHLSSVLLSDERISAQAIREDERID